MQQNKK